MKQYHLKSDNKQYIFDGLSKQLQVNSELFLQVRDKKEHQKIAKRSNGKNAALNAWLKIIGDFTGYSSDEVYYNVVMQFYEDANKLVLELGGSDTNILIRANNYMSKTRPVYQIRDQIMICYASTTKLTNADFSRFLFSIDQWAAEQGIQLPRNDF